MKVPDMIKSNDPAEIIEFHIAGLMEKGAIPPTFKLSDTRRQNLLVIVTALTKFYVPPKFYDAMHTAISMAIVDAIKAQRYETG